MKLNLDKVAMEYGAMWLRALLAEERAQALQAQLEAAQAPEQKGEGKP